MKKILLVSIGALAMLTIAGCGGSGGGGGGGSLIGGGSNPYAGSYSGTFDNTTLNQFGAVNFIVNSSGTITGGAEYTATGTITLTGTVTSTGVATITGSGGGESGTASGQLSTAGTSPVTGNFTFISGSLSGDAFTIDVTVSTATGNPYAGNYTGTFDDTTESMTGTITLDINADGSVTSGVVTPTSGTGSFLGGTVSSTGVVNFLSAKASGAGPIQTVTGQLSAPNTSPVTGVLTQAQGPDTIDVSISKAD